MDERTANLFRNGRNQAVRIPREFEMPGSRVTIRKLPDGRLEIEPIPEGGLLLALRGVQPLAQEDWMDQIEELPAEPIDL